MRTIKISPSCREITLGRQGENAATVVEFDVSSLRQTYGDGTPHLFHRRPCDAAAYPVAITTEGDTVRWVVTTGDTAHRTSATHGQAEMHWIVGETLAKSVIWRTYILEALETGGVTPPDAVKPWYNQLLDAIEDIRHSGGGVTEEQLQQAIEDWMKEHPAPPGEKGDKGDDYLLTDFDREEIAGEAAEKIKPEIFQLKENLATKATNPKSPVVGQWGRVKEIDADGRPLWETAELPIATAKTPGIINKVSGGYGVGMNAAAGLFVVTTPNSLIGVRASQSNQAVTLNKLDDCVKAAMCDGQGAAWDTASQLAALARLGITVDDGICHFG